MAANISSDAIDPDMWKVRIMERLECTLCVIHRSTHNQALDGTPSKGLL